MFPLRLVIDTNVLISAAINPTGLQRTVLLVAITKPARLYVSGPILEEYGEVLTRPELQIRKGLRQQLLQLIMGLSPGVRQTVKALLTVRWNCIVPRKPFLARWAPAGEAAAGSAGAQPAKE